MEKTVVFLVTVPGPGEGERVAKHLLREHLVACVNVIPRIRSFYFWEGKIQDEGETLLVCKTTSDKSDAFIAAVRSVHTYEQPEIVGMTGSNVDKKYAKWISEYVHSAAPDS